MDPQYGPHRGLRYPIRREREGRGQEKGRKGVLHYHTRYLCIPLVGSSYLVVVSDTIHHTMYHRYHTPYHTPVTNHLSTIHYPLLLFFFLSSIYLPISPRSTETPSPVANAQPHITLQVVCSKVTVRLTFTTRYHMLVH